MKNTLVLAYPEKTLRISAALKPEYSLHGFNRIGR